MIRQAALIHAHLQACSVLSAWRPVLAVVPSDAQGWLLLPPPPMGGLGSGVVGERGLRSYWLREAPVLRLQIKRVFPFSLAESRRFRRV